MIARCGGLVYTERQYVTPDEDMGLPTTEACHAARHAARTFLRVERQLPNCVEVADRTFTVMGMCEWCDRILLQEEPTTSEQQADIAAGGTGEMVADAYAVDEDGCRVCLGCVSLEAA